jgi:hypothetical protein
MVLRTDRIIPGLKVFHPDIASFGKHYLIRCLSLPKVRRNYTIPNSMRKCMYDEYVRVTREYL